MKFYSSSKLLHGALVLALLAAAPACKKLDLDPTDTIDPDKAFRNVADLNLGLLGAYAVLDNSLLLSAVTVADEVTLPIENTVSNNDAFRWQYNATSSSVTGAWASLYQAIDRANRVLAAVDKVGGTATDQTLKNQYQGELLALRAYAHFELLRGYAADYEPGALGVPYMKESKISSPARATFEQNVADIKADLAQAKTLIPASFTDNTRIRLVAVAAMQARLALYEKNWADAITYSSEVITALPLATRAQFPGIWTDANSSEVAWKLKRVTGDSRLGDSFFRQSGGIVLYAPALKLLNAFDKTNDVRYGVYIKFDPTRTGTKSQYLVNKYIGGTASAPGLVDVKLFRTGEMYLIRAEAQAESGNLTAAAADLNALRAARLSGYTAQSFADKAALVAAIYTERFKELAFEGQRFFDLKRRNLPVERLAADAANASGAVLLPPTQAQYNFPIPFVELQVNPNMVQNPGY
ncbi:RagB/SusD family nutrient uptake outer membrane protein [Hymenobacter sp. ISL-91]|uniref:RagB/SusD family nutrient uptake outer membrane protein n=1 Tax=Hymenobacter sp. ISL-91 TaxID=2819151 RepID=UPI001BED22B5|nr:RagB/SusD family nutrient uptake outer membrane protein [Hymenobacter sp. ISL-91]MBT2557090.1 RagB/SusD family nutrient uptake outer membrane protein [Hymenobacter sp. ISL-91]